MDKESAVQTMRAYFDHLFATAPEQYHSVGLLFNRTNLGENEEVAFNKLISLNAATHRIPKDREEFYEFRHEDVGKWRVKIITHCEDVIRDLPKDVSYKTIVDEFRSQLKRLNELRAGIYKQAKYLMKGTIMLDMISAVQTMRVCLDQMYAAVPEKYYSSGLLFTEKHQLDDKKREALVDLFFHDERHRLLIPKGRGTAYVVESLGSGNWIATITTLWEDNDFIWDLPIPESYSTTVDEFIKKIKSSEVLTEFIRDLTKRMGLSKD